MPYSDGELIDDGGKRPSSTPSRLNPLQRRNSVEPPPPRFQLRRQPADSNSNSNDQWFTQRGATDEIREHLKHLGPSNLASRPRQTRYNTVKIKRAGNSPSRSPQTQSHLDAKDGAHALQAGYGTLRSARSGSITEQTVDVNGVRKVVLHTNSTSSSEEEPLLL